MFDQKDISELYVIRFEGKYLSKGQDIGWTYDLNMAELFNNKGCAESLCNVFGKKIEFEVINVKDLEKEENREG